MKVSFTVGAAGRALPLLEQRKAWRNFEPSPTGIGIGMLILFNAVATRGLGALADWVWGKLRPASHERY
jgi:hypothetical protein